MIWKYYLSLTDQCNISCIYCHQGEKCKSHFSSTPDLERLVKQFPATGEYEVFLYGGEPLLEFGRLEKVTYLLKERNPEIKFAVVTNGTLLDKHKIKVINDLDISVGLSHDGKYHEITRGIRDILKYDPDLYLSLNKRSISATVCRINYDFYDVWDYLEEFKIKHNLPQRENVFIQVVKDVNNNTGEHLLIKDMPEFEAMLDKTFSNLKRQLKVGDVSGYELMEYISLIKVLASRIKEPSKIASYCCAESNVCHLDVYGNLYSCHNWYIPNGNIYTEGIQPGRFNPYLYEQKCLDCDAYIICGGGCPATVKEKHPHVCYTMYHQVMRLIRLLNELAYEGGTNLNVILNK